jgi:hypothetical protein
MKIYDMFEKKIDRPITGVVKVGQIEDADKKQELEEYVVTRGLTKHFREFFTNYTNSIKNPTDEMGVWISGFFGSGKSHFLKILSYDLDNTVVAGKHPWEYLVDNNPALKDDAMLLADMQLAANTPTDAILFNVDSKSAASAKSDSNAIVMVFNRVFNEKLGYIGSIPALADLERQLDEEGLYQKFQETYKSVTGDEWLASRHKFKIMRSKVEKTLVKMGYMTEEDAALWTKESSTLGYQIAIDEFADRVKAYVDRTGRRVVFLVDEIGQFISTDSHLMLNLQTITEELGTRCKGRVWVIVTAQEDIDSMTENMQERANDFSKIQGRFKTRLSLTSANADEVIKERILKKKDVGKQTLMALYDSEEVTIQNAVDFQGTAIEMKKIKNSEEFADCYPFLPYQFNLLADVLNAIRLNSSTGKHLSEGERSMLGAYQKAAEYVMNGEEGALVPFYRFYDDLIKFLDHTHAGVIQRAYDNERLNPLHDDNCFTINVLKTLFLLKYVNGVALTVGNIVSLMISDIHDDRKKLRNEVEESLQLLVRNLLVSQIQDTYEFLTDEEQDINRAIRDRNIQQTDVIRAVAKVVFDSIYNNSRYRVPKFNGRYTFAYNQTVDNVPFKNNQNSEIGLRIITPKYVSAEGGADDMTLTMMSARNKEVILKLPVDAVNYYNELLNSLKIDDYIRNVADPQKGKSTAIRTMKMQESGQSRDAAVSSLKEAIGNAEVFINGQKITDITSHEPITKINSALERLIDNIYYKLSYIDSPKDDNETRKLFIKDNQTALSLGEQKTPNSGAIDEMKEHVRLTSSDHTSISMKSLITDFAAAPWGYNDQDVKWLIAKAFMDGAAALYVEKEPVTLFNRTPEDLGNYFTSRKYEDKLLFKAKQTIDPGQVKICRDIIKQLFNKTETDNDADKIMATFRQEARDTIKDCNEMLKECAQVKEYPGKETLEQAVRTLSEIQVIDDTSLFFKKIAEQKSELLDLSEDLAPVKTFYTMGTQQKIFNENGLRAIRFYENSKEHINNEELAGVMEEIGKIVHHKTPYNLIKNLPALYQSFMDIYGKVLDEKLAPVLDVIEQDKNNVLNYMKGQFYEGELKPQASSDFFDLAERAKKESDISDMLGFKDKADSLCKNWLDRLANMIPPEDPAPVTPDDTGDDDQPAKPAAPAKRQKTLMARDITSETWVISNEEDLEKNLDKIRARVKEELAKNDIVQLKF